jgi:hypothetical protein
MTVIQAKWNLTGLDEQMNEYRRLNFSDQ